MEEKKETRHNMCNILFSNELLEDKKYYSLKKQKYKSIRSTISHPCMHELVNPDVINALKRSKSV